jgi:hypothetical protein
MHHEAVGLRPDDIRSVHDNVPVWVVVPGEHSKKETNINSNVWKRLRPMWRTADARETCICICFGTPRDFL